MFSAEPWLYRLRIADCGLRIERQCECKAMAMHHRATVNRLPSVMAQASKTFPPVQVSFLALYDHAF
jgi:hypothetical protein